jgi:hypothetical protein
VTAVYAVSLTVGALALLAWMIAHGVARNADRPDRDPEERFGVVGRRIVAAAVGFGIAGMSAEFAAIEIPTLGVLGLAFAGGAGAAVWAGFAGDDSETAG